MSDGGHTVHTVDGREIPFSDYIAERNLEAARTGAQRCACQHARRAHVGHGDGDGAGPCTGYRCTCQAFTPSSAPGLHVFAFDVDSEDERFTTFDWYACHDGARAEDLSALAYLDVGEETEIAGSRVRRIW